MQDLIGKNIILRPLQSSYIKDYLAQFSVQVRSILHVNSLDTEHEYLQEQLVSQSEGKSLFYCIFIKDILIGAVVIRDKTIYGSGQLYSWLNENYWGRGYYQEALSLIADYYFKMTQDQFFTARVDVDNLRSYYALKKAGFVDIGISHGANGKQYELLLRKK